MHLTKVCLNPVQWGQLQHRRLMIYAHFILKNVEREYSNPHGYGDYVA